MNNIKKYIKAVYDLYMDTLNNTLNRNNENIMVKVVYIKFEPLKQGSIILQLYKVQNSFVLQLSKEFE